VSCWIEQAGSREVFDIDGTREAARQRALPKMEDLPPAQRRLDEVCAPGYTGRKRGEVVRTRTVVSQAHSYQWLGSFGNKGNGEYREELAHALGVIRRYLAAHGLPQARALLRLDGLYGTGAVITDLAGFSFVMRGKDYTVLDDPLVQARLHLPPDTHFSRPESGLVRQLYDCPDVPVGKKGNRCRVVVATHPAASKKSRIGQTREGVVYELFFTQLPQDGFTASDVVALYLHRGAFEPVLSDEDEELDPDRWCSHSPGLPRSLADHLAVGVERGSWNWVMCLSRLPYARPRLLPPSLPSQRPERSRRPCRAMTPLRLLHPGKLVAFLGRTSPSSRMGHCAVRLIKR
jgi:hypothetical protein